MSNPVPPPPADDPADPASAGEPTVSLADLGITEPGPSVPSSPEAGSVTPGSAASASPLPVDAEPDTVALASPEPDSVTVALPMPGGSDAAGGSTADYTTVSMSTPGEPPYSAAPEAPAPATVQFGEVPASADDATVTLPPPGEPPYSAAPEAPGVAAAPFGEVPASEDDATVSMSTPGEPPYSAAPEAPRAVAAPFGAVPAAKPKKPIRRGVLGVVGVIVVVIIVGVIMLAVGGGNNDKAEKAKVGDCVAALGKVSDQAGKNSQTAAKVVNCTANDAAYKVIGRVNGQTNTESKACDKFFTDAKADYFIYASTSGDGYLLCLQSTKA